MEKSGYDVTYATDVDTHTNGSHAVELPGHPLTGGHDEYWSKPMYDAVIAARDAGVNLGFFGANAIYWQVRFEASSSGAANRVLVCYKEAARSDHRSDPDDRHWRNPPVNRPSRQLIGVEFTDGPNNGSAPYVVTNSGNWVYAGTSFKDGDSLPGLVGYEADRFVSEDPPPVAVSGTYTLLSHSPYTGSHGADYSNSSIYQAPSEVFSSEHPGCISPSGPPSCRGALACGSVQGHSHPNQPLCRICRTGWREAAYSLR